MSKRRSQTRRTSTRQPSTRRPSARSQPTRRAGRLIGFAVVAVVVVAGTAGYLVYEHAAQQEAIRNAPSLPVVALAEVDSKPRIVFRSNSRAHYGVVAMVSLNDPSGPRALTSTSCERLYADQDDVLCMYLDRSTILYDAKILNAQMHTTSSLPISGIPSRARLSPDGALAATTTFTRGDSYTSTDVSTRTYISTLTGPRSRLSREDDFDLIHQGKKIAPVDRNYWGVTFAADDDRFYATVSFSGHTWLVRGDLEARTLTTLREDAECPSLAPDGRTIVYKKRFSNPAGHWRLVALNLATGTETKLAETRSVDDQVEWLDNDHVLYALPGRGDDASVYDVYDVPADGTGEPTLLIPEASSPAVIR